MRSGLFHIIMIIAVGASAHAYDWTTNPGDGSPESPYQISEPNHLMSINSNPDSFYKHFILTNDIIFDPDNNPSHVFNDSLITPIYDMEHEQTHFIGIFDGQGFSIKNLTIENTNKNFLGLFGAIRDSGKVVNLHLVDAHINGLGLAGSLMAWNNEATIFNCSATGVVEGQREIGIGGLVGVNWGLISNSSFNGIIKSQYCLGYIGGLTGGNSGMIVNCFSNISIVNSGDGIGGLVGVNIGTIERCYSIGSIEGEMQLGGFVWRNEEDGIISNCFSRCSVDGWDGLGGFASGNEGHISNSYSTGLVNGDLAIGGFVAVNTGNIANCFFLKTAGPNNGFGIPLNEMDMKYKSSFEGWDFVGESMNGDNDIWRMCVDGVDYPRLSWEFARNGDFACGDGVDLADLQALADCWLLAEAINPTTFSYACDANGDEVIDLADFAVLSDNWP